MQIDFTPEQEDRLTRAALFNGKVRWTRRAIRDLIRITRYIQRDSPAAADRVAIIVETIV